MAEAIFNYEGNNTIIQCNINDKMKDIINKFLIKIDKKEIDDFFFLYNGAEVNKELTFNDQANDIDKQRKKLNIIVNEIKKNQKKYEIISKDIICPECKKNTLIEIKDFKINLSGCKNNHIKNDKLLIMMIKIIYAKNIMIHSLNIVKRVKKIYVLYAKKNIKIMIL